MSRNKYPEETVNLILDVSQRLFIEKGYDNTTIKDIIDELKRLGAKSIVITSGAIYHHFSSKQDILDAVIERLFAKNTLSASWRKIQSDTGITGGEKLKRMLAAALTDEQEQQFRKLGVHLQNMPQMLSDLVLRSVNDIAPNAFEPVIEEGVRDGSLSVMFPKQAAEAVSLIANIWINPLVFPVDNEELKAKFEFICGITKSIGLDISDIYPLLDKMNSDINL